MPVSQITEPCWILDPLAEQDDEGGPTHYRTQAAAAKYAAEMRPGDGITARALPGPCWTVSCDGPGCDERPEDDEYGFNIHCTSRLEAETFAESCGWILTRAGEVFCPNCASDCSTADLAVVGEIPGQLTIEDVTDA